MKTQPVVSRRRSTLALLCVLVAGAVTAATFTVAAQDRIAPPRPVPPIWPPRPIPPALNQELQLVSQSAQVEIDGAVARTKLAQTFRNTTNRRIEGTYVFPLPEGAAVSGFAMTVNGKRMEAEILEGEKAREIYAGIVAKMRDPAILEYIDRNLIKAKIFPIEPRAEQKVELEYSESLRSEAGSFRYVVPLRLPVGGSAQQASVDVRITSPDGIKGVYSPTHEVEVRREGDAARVTGEFGEAPSRLERLGIYTHEVPRRSDRDFVLYYTTGGARVGVNLITHKEAGEDGYFMMLLAPDPQIAQTEIPAKDVIFVFDTSGSMAGEKIEQARQALLNLISNLNPGDRFNIVTFSSDTRQFREGLVPADKSTLEAARNWTNGIKAVGGTNINDALVHAIKMFPPKAAWIKGQERPANALREQQVLFMTDGQPTVGETDVTQILQNIRVANAFGFSTPTEREIKTNTQPKVPHILQGARMRIFVFGVGYDVNTRLLDSLASENRGATDYVLPNEDIEAKVNLLYNKIAFPVLSNPRLDWGGIKVYDVYPKVLPDLFKGTQTIVFGRYEGGSTRAPRLIGTASGREESISGQGSFSGGKNGTLPRLWATRKTGYLMDDARRNGRTVDAEVKEEIIKLSKKYGIVTPFTAGLITEDEPTSAMRPPGAGGARGQAGTSTPAFNRSLAGAMAADTGQDAVLAARMRQDFRQAETLQDTSSQKLTVRTIEGKTFSLKDGVWTDESYDPQSTLEVQTITFASPEYFALLKDSRVAKWLSVGERVLVVLDDRILRIEPT